MRVHAFIWSRHGTAEKNRAESRCVLSVWVLSLSLCLSLSLSSLTLMDLHAAR
ncbi:hypothetical protein PO909_014996 [Leuciscus waleckii]